VPGSAVHQGALDELGGSDLRLGPERPGQRGREALDETAPEREVAGDQPGVGSRLATADQVHHAVGIESEDAHAPQAAPQGQAHARQHVRAVEDGVLGKLRERAHRRLGERRLDAPRRGSDARAGLESAGEGGQLCRLEDQGVSLQASWALSTAPRDVRRGFRSPRAPREDDTGPTAEAAGGLPRGCGLLVAGPILGARSSRSCMRGARSTPRSTSGRSRSRSAHGRRRSSTRSRSSPPLQSAPRPSSRTPPTSTARSSRSSRASAARGPGSLRRISAC
jgi:hypothetical protein